MRYLQSVEKEEKWLRFVYISQEEAEHKDENKDHEIDYMNEDEKKSLRKAQQLYRDKGEEEKNINECKNLFSYFYILYFIFYILYILYSIYFIFYIFYILF